MPMQDRKQFWLGVVLGAAVIVSCSVASTSHAQSTTDPYNPWNWTYNPYTTPMSPLANPAIPNQARIEALGTGSRLFDTSIDGYGGGEEDLFGRGGGRYGYYGTGGLEDRVYRPNRNDDEFFRERRERDARYFEIMKETDLKKRAQMLKEYNLENRRAALGLSGANAKAEARRTTQTPLSRRRSGIPVPGAKKIAKPKPSSRSAFAAPTQAPTTAKPRSNTTTPRTGRSSTAPGRAGTSRSTNSVSPFRRRELTPAETLRRAQSFGRGSSSSDKFPLPPSAPNLDDSGASNPQ